jgi:hypothetical protein
MGVRYTCSQCPETNLVDLCSKCINLGFESGKHTKEKRELTRFDNSISTLSFIIEYHTLNHEFDRIDYAEAPYYQHDGSEFMGEASYLDPVSH